MQKQTIKDIKDLAGKTVLVRCDFNVPLEDGKITDDSRIVGALPTIEYLKKANAKVVLASHLGRPKGERKPEFSLAPVAKSLSSLLGQNVALAPDCIGAKVEKMVSDLADGDVLLLENVRFYKEETKNDPDFSKQLATLADIYVLDAFGTAHRAHASTEGVTKYLPAYAGFLIEKELNYFGQALGSPKRPLVAIIGGAKVSSKIAVLKSMLDKVDTILIGGGMAYTFFKQQGHEVGLSILETDYLDTAKEVVELAKAKGVKLLLPVDITVGDDFSNDCNIKNCRTIRNRAKNGKV